MIVEALVPGFLFGVANSAHCAGMCGVFAAQAASACGSCRGSLRMGLYLAGKTFTYAFLGAVAGYLGGQALAAATGAQTVIGLLTGAVLVAAGIVVLRGTAAETRLGAWWAATLRPVVSGVRRARSLGGPFALGAATGFLPCGVVYLAALQGAALGDPGSGALLMVAFGLGTVPVLLLVGLAGRGLLQRLGATRLRIAGGLLIVVTGLFTVGRALLPLFAEAGPGGVPCCH